MLYYITAAETAADLGGGLTGVRCTHLDTHSARHAVPLPSLTHLETGFLTHALPLVPRFFALQSDKLILMF